MADGPTNVRFDAATVEALKKAADDAGVSVSAWVRSVVDAEVERRSRPQDAASLLFQAMVAFGPTVIFARENAPGLYANRLQDGYNNVLAVYESLSKQAARPTEDGQ